ncbi:MAG: GNAT family N-acetyltransferase [Acidobacteria bacterium]|nr:GNAT family N-acetyltransferase [Acidobacteriota bacterium]
MARTKESLEDGFRTLLDEWGKASLRGEYPGDLAGAILETMEDLAQHPQCGAVGIILWHECLRLTARSNFIRSLQDRESQSRWAEACFRVIQLSEYSLLRMFEQRAGDFPDRNLFEDLTPGARGGWSYGAVRRQVREMAAAFLSMAAPAEPRVAIVADNSVSGACCDLACLFYDILDSPLNPHLNAETLADIFNRLRINIAVTDTDERIERLLEVAAVTDAPFHIVALHNGAAGRHEGIAHLGACCKRLGEAAIAESLERRRRFSLDEVATVMFTSGSEGIPKGVSFSCYNLVAKRFARAASLPDVGNEEILLCYLPLYHTFGRYLEMLGSIFWGGTYVFTGNPSLDTLLAFLPVVNPTGFISVPLRWAQIEEYCADRMRNAADKGKAFRSVVGTRLRWGLSAAGYLEPGVFRFFNRNGVALSSGFGMTEATGGITMTPSWEYVDDTNGIPLPGIRARLTAQGELQLSGHYVARYLNEAGPGDRIPYPVSIDGDYWLSTGDIFRVHPNGYYQILDRIKDIYKNDKGQTIAPRLIEKKFEGVPGIKRTYLVGDRKAYNVLLIVPDGEHPILKTPGVAENRRDYFRQIVSAVNRNVAPYERVVNFEILDRDFRIDLGELTPKGTLNRGRLDKNFAPLIQDLYKNSTVEFRVDSFRVRIPRWFYRELSVLEDDIRVTHSGLYNLETGRTLRLGRTDEPGTFLVGDLEYRVSEGVLDLGVFARQPRLWIGNPALILFCPCREGWDTPLGSVSPQVLRPRNAEAGYSAEEFPDLPRVKERLLININQLVSTALFGNDRNAIQAVQDIGRMISRTDLRWNEIFRRRLEALSRHPLERIRSLAYQILLLDDPSPDYGKVFPAFIESGLTFADPESMEVIAGSFEKYRLEALRQRMLTYRSQLEWPAKDATVRQFERLFRLMLNFVDAHPGFYFPVRAELAAWRLFRAEPRLAESARDFLLDLYRRFEIKLAEEASKNDASTWKSKLVYDEILSLRERRRIEKLLIQTPFLRQAVMFALQDERFSLDDVAEKGIWISAIPSLHAPCRYRMSINLKKGRHYDLELVLGEDFRRPRSLESLYWTIAIGGHPVGPRVLPRPGCFSTRMRARSSVFLSEMTAWEKIREYSEFRGPNAPSLRRHAWRRLYIQSLTAFYRGWMQSGSQIVPGKIAPDNVTVPELDFKSDGTIVSLMGWRRYKDPVSLVRPMMENFYRKVEAHYPWCAGRIEVSWIFDACLEAMGVPAGRRFLESLRLKLGKSAPMEFGGVPLTERLEAYMAETKIYLPMAFYNAVDRYEEFSALNAKATPQAREQTVDELYWLFRLNEFPEFVRYSLYRQTYFIHARKDIQRAFDKLLSRLRGGEGTPAVQMEELSALQGALASEEDRNVFSRLVFPSRLKTRKLEVSRIGDSERERVVVGSRISGGYSEEYVFREPLQPREIGQLYNYFFRQSIPRAVSELDRYFVLVDPLDKIVGGICYHLPDQETAQIEGIVVDPTLQGRGLRRAMEEEFCGRMAGQGVRVVRAHYFLLNFYLKLGYSIDKRWGTLVKFLYPEARTP